MRLELKKLAVYFSLSGVLGLVACVTFPSENQDPAKNNKATYNKDFRECQEDYPELGSGAHYRQWVSCMNLKGWK